MTHGWHLIWLQAVDSNEITRVLSRLFLLMAHGPHAWVDTEPLVSVLALSPAVQQDGSEFLKLLLTKVESLLGPSPVSVSHAYMHGRSACACVACMGGARVHGWHAWA